MLYYPAVMVSAVLLVFVWSLFHTPVAEVCARKMGAKLDEAGIRYCRKATIAWVIFLSVHLMITVFTVFASREIWVTYNGAIAYGLMGLMFAGEWIVRRKVAHG